VGKEGEIKTLKKIWEDWFCWVTGSEPKGKEDVFNAGRQRGGGKKGVKDVNS